MVPGHGEVAVQTALAKLIKLFVVAFEDVYVLILNGKVQKVFSQRLDSLTFLSGVGADDSSATGYEKGASWLE